MDNRNNRLLNRYYNMNQNNNNTNRNPLINQNHGYTQQQINYMNTKQMQMNQHMQKIKQLQYQKKMEILKNIDRIDEDKIKESVIKPTKIEVSQNERGDIENEYNVRDNVYKTVNTYNNHMKIFWNKRTNEPYKNILKDEDYSKEIKKEDDLIVHKVTTVDKDQEILETELKDKLSVMEKHNDELKVIYSTSNELEHKKKFEYNHTYKYKTKFKTSNSESVRNDSIAFFKDEQKRLEKDKKKMENIFESMVNTY